MSTCILQELQICQARAADLAATAPMLHEPFALLWLTTAIVHAQPDACGVGMRPIASGIGMGMCRLLSDMCMARPALCQAIWIGTFRKWTSRTAMAGI